MRRSELINAVSIIIAALNSSHMEEICNEIFESRRKGPSDESPFPVAALAEAMKRYNIASNKYGDIEKKLINNLDLNFMEDTSFWSSLFVKDYPLGELHLKYQSIKFALQNLPKIIEMIEPQSILHYNKEHESEGSIYSGKDLLSVIVIEEGDLYSSPERLTLILQSVEGLYDVCATIFNSNEKLSVISCDSGSDKSFDFLGAAKIIECVKDVILSLWDRVLFFREQKIQNRIDLVAQSLPIINQISTLENEGKLEPEQAEILRRKVSDGASKFLDAGATIPEIEERSSFNARKLMAPEPKLLVGPSPDLTKKEEPIDEELKDNQKDDKNELSVKEQKELLKLLRKANQPLAKKKTTSRKKKKP